MTEYKTVSFEKEFYENLEQYVDEETDFRSPKQFLAYIARREMDENRLRKIVQQEIQDGK